MRSDPGNGGGKHGGDQVEVEESKDTRESRVSFFFFSEGGMEARKGAQTEDRGDWMIRSGDHGDRMTYSKK